MPRHTRYSLLIFFFGIAAAAYGVYFFRAAHFFQGDTIYWFYHRLHSFGEFARSFSSPDPGGWYRPLTNRTVQSLLYPFFGFEPAGYRWVVYSCFLADIVAVFALAALLTKRWLAAAIAAVFFTFHTVNAYTTYDLAFVPELTYTFFYICAVIAFLWYLNSGKQVLKVVSLGCFVLSLCSKEAAVTLPLTLAIVAFGFTRSIRKVATDLIPFGVLLAAYLWFALFHLGVASEALASLHNAPAQLETGGYYFMVGPHILGNAATAFAWALNLPVGILGQWRDATRIRSLVLWSFAVIQTLLIACSMSWANRRAALLGIALFWIGLLPALPLLGHFLPSYLFLPIAGFAVLVGATWDALYQQLSKRMPIAAVSVLGATFALLAIVCAKSARSEARNNFLLGASSRSAETALQDLRTLYPIIPPSSTVFINDDAQPDLAFHHAGGALFMLGYGDDSLQFRYSSRKESPTGATIKLIFRDGHLHRE